MAWSLESPLSSGGLGFLGLPEDVEEELVVGDAGEHAGGLGNGLIETQVRHARVFVGAMAGDAALGQQRADVALVIDGEAHAGGGQKESRESHMSP